jgi:hypothetical protein
MDVEAQFHFLMPCALSRSIRPNGGGETLMKRGEASPAPLLGESAHQPANPFGLSERSLIRVELFPRGKFTKNPDPLYAERETRRCSRTPALGAALQRLLPQRFKPPS